MSDAWHGSAPAPADQDSVMAIYKRDVDRSLLRENLKKTPTERVKALMELQRLAAEARLAGRSRLEDRVVGCEA
jgi:hypothetical protein